MKNFTSGLPKAVAVAFAAPLIVGFVIFCFLWPTAKMDPHNLPVAIVGPEQAIAQAEQGLAAQSGDLLDLQVMNSRDDAVHAIETREVDGAIILGQQAEVLTSSAASSASNSIMLNLAQGLGNMTKQEVKTTDVVPLATSDPSGTGLAMVAVPLAFGSIIGAALLSFTNKDTRLRLLGLLIYAPLAGMMASFVMHTWLGLLPGSYWSIMGVSTLTFFAIGTFIAGLYSAIGQAGFGLGALTIMFFGNPLSAPAYPTPVPAGRMGHHRPAATQWRRRNDDALCHLLP